MEWDVGLPWYRPTRVCHLVSGADFGYRHGSGKLPSYYPDTVPAAVEIGTSSPTGVVFGTAARFPSKYRRALFALDWAYGTIFAVHLESDGASYRGTFEKFATGRPLPVTDAAIGPDGAFYFITGGRGTQSGLYRITHRISRGGSSEIRERGEETTLRRHLEQFHGQPSDEAVETAWEHLAHSDRFVRHAARLAAT